MYKQVILIRSDLKMSRGKIAAQAAHAAFGSARRAGTYRIRKWSEEGQKKVILRGDLKRFRSVLNKCKKYRLPFFVVNDAGLTEVPVGTTTALGIGPDKEEKINKVTGSLPLLK